MGSLHDFLFDFNSFIGHNSSTGDKVGITSLVTGLLMAMNKTILNTPNVFDSGIFDRAYTVVWVLSSSFLLIMLGINGFKLLTAKFSGSYIRPTEFMSRLIIAGGMIFLSMPYIKFSINASNTICQVIAKNIFNMEAMSGDIVAGGSLFGLVLLVLGLLPAMIILFVRWAIRVVYLVTISICAPIACLGWVNPHSSGIFTTWFKEINLAIFTPCVQALFYGICSNIIMLLNSSQTSIAGASLSIIFTLASIVLMIITPEIFRKFMYNSYNPLQLVGSLNQVGTMAGISKFIRR